MASTTYDIGGGLTAKSGLFGISAPKLSKELLLQDLQNTAQVGRYDTEKEKALGRATEGIGAVQQAQQQDIAQQTMAGGPLAAVSGRGAALQRDLAGQGAEGVAQAASATENVYLQKEQAERQAALADLRAQQDRARENAQGWMKTLFGGLAEGAGSAAGEAGVAALAACWVAEELYGVADARTHAARYYVATHDGPFLRMYREHGATWAAWLRAHPWAKLIVRPLWDFMAWRGTATMDVTATTVRG